MAKAVAKMECHYEVMGMASRTVSFDEIKSQYKRLALKWHPDRNYGQEDYATEMFKRVSSAYAVLSDPHERKWYDDHRESILRGGDGTNKGSGGSRGLDKDIDMDDLWQYFNTSCYSGFEDTPDGKGFYQVYGSIFQAITQQEDEASEHLTDSPPFGDASSSRSDVALFYSHWSNFVTCLSFSWEDEYNPSDAPNRDVRRAIEKENKKAREVGRKKYIDVVRALVAYAKKRDPRMQVIEAEKQRKKDEDIARKKQAELEEKARRAEARQRRQEFGGVEDEADRLRRLEERKGAFLLADDSSDDDGNRRRRKGSRKNQKQEDYNSEDEFEEGSDQGVAMNDSAESHAEEEQTTFNCEVCDKTFKFLSQLEQHCQSKVHRKNLKDKGGGGKGKKGPQPPPPPSVARKENVFKSFGRLGLDDEDDIEDLEDEDDEEGHTANSSTQVSGKRDKNPKCGKVMETFEEDSDGEGGDGIGGDFACGACEARFQTRNKLFTHLQALGHSLPQGQANVVAPKKSKKKNGIAR